MMYTLEVLGKPMGKQRVKFGKGFTYTPKETVNYENYVKTLFQSKYGQPLLKGKINISLKAYFNIPKSTNKKQKEKMLLGNVKPLKKPDCDNIAKVILDSLNNVAYEDDKQVVSLTVFFIKLVSNKMIERLKLKIEMLTDLKEKIQKYKGRYN